MTATRLDIHGMHCAGCVNSVQKRLSQLDGVHEAVVDLNTHSARVQHDDVDAQRLIGAVKDAGYDASVAHRAGQAEPTDDAESGHGEREGHGHHHGSAPGIWAWPLIVSLASAAMVLAMGMTWKDLASAWIQLPLTLAVFALLGRGFVVATWRGLKKRRANMDTLVVLGAGSALVYSTGKLLVASGQGADTVVVFFDTAAVIVGLVGLGRSLEGRARSRTASAIRGLMNLQPPEATRIDARGDEERVPVGQLQPGDRVRVRPGDRVAVDGKVVEGSSSVDQSQVTGESTPVEVEPGSEVFAGSSNASGSFIMEATATGEDMLLSRVTELVRTAQASKPDVQRTVDVVASYFVPAVLVVALLTLLGYGLIAGAWLAGMNAMIAVLLVACPCALGLATPTAVAVGMGIGAKTGILIRDAQALERSGRLDAIVLDKTGTVTVGRSQVTGVTPREGHDADELLRLAAGVERASEHPIGQAIVREAERRGLELPSVSDFQSVTAGGVRGDVEGRAVVVGRLSTLRGRGVAVTDDDVQERDAAREDGRTAVVIAMDGEVAGLVTLADQLRAEAAEVIAALKRMGLSPMLLTGDADRPAQVIAERVGIDEVLSEVKPDQKQARVERLQAEGRKVAMVGDGINDAPALAAADLGVAMGSGSDIAIDAGHVVLLHPDLRLLPRLVTLSRLTMRRIHLGLFWAFIYNVCLIPLAVGGLLHPMLAAGAMAASSLCVVGNALYLRRTWAKKGAG